MVPYGRTSVRSCKAEFEDSGSLSANLRGRESGKMREVRKEWQVESEAHPHCEAAGEAERRLARPPSAHVQPGACLASEVSLQRLCSLSHKGSMAASPLRWQS